MGCLFYELLFHKKAFDSDFAVYDYSTRYLQSGETLLIPSDSELIINDSQLKRFAITILMDMLRTSASERPSANTLYRRFNSFMASVGRPRPFIRAKHLEEITGKVLVNIDEGIIYIFNS
jgi:hypothetical protein